MMSVLSSTREKRELWFHAVGRGVGGASSSKSPALGKPVCTNDALLSARLVGRWEGASAQAFPGLQEVSRQSPFLQNDPAGLVAFVSFEEDTAICWPGDTGVLQFVCMKSTLKHGSIYS